MKQPKILLETQPEMIRHLRADSNYTILFLTDGKRLISGYSLNVFQKLFDDQEFLRINRSNIVHKTFIAEIKLSKSVDSIRLLNNTEIQIPRRRRVEVLEAFSNY
ncbi:LytTR family DNA-binding domain-containing protein [Lacihabitans sp. LS3-19]|uniref:LytTR family DNA-binding domain-containing protein n=1 Tax=Lacihabitans sp. LS3-19 TaxID=2487335 RepID=UPI0020CE61D7|nr:LytTR family DNA-binding domain-containing protein [Lacihabitans sp. LS3-19]